MKKVILFGAGKYYQKYKHYIEDEIVAICDNAKEKKGKRIDGHLVISPDEIMHYNPDEIIILSIYINEIREQLCKLGIDSSIIKAFYEIKYEKEINEIVYNNTTIERSKERILVVSHDLSTTGAPIALLEAVNQLRNLGYFVTVASPDDGDMREAFLSNCDQLVIDEKLRFSKLSEIEWTGTYSLVFINTVHLFYLLRDLKPTQRVLWWLHEPECFYSSVDSKCIAAFDFMRISVFAVSEIARDAFVKICNVVDCRILPLCIKDCPRETSANYEELNCILIGEISKLKGQAFVVEAIRRVTRYTDRKVKVLFIGGDASALAGELKATVEREKLPIYFLGKVSNYETLGYIEKCNLLICASEVETLSVSVLEGMMKKVACLVTDSSGIHTYISNFSDGIVFHACDVDDIFNKLLWCMDNLHDLEKIGNRGRKIYEKYFSVEKFQEAIYEVINSLTISYL